MTEINNIKPKKRGFKLQSALVAGVYLLCIGAYAQAISLQDARKKFPELAGLSDESALNVIHQLFYPHMDKSELASKLGVKLSEAKNPKQLGSIDKWRFESCQTDAAKAPTSQGVVQGMRVCKDKFEQ